jgi:hypothetical protein
MLDSISRSLPDRLWLTDLQQKEWDITMKGEDRRSRQVRGQGDVQGARARGGAGGGTGGTARGAMTRFVKGSDTETTRGDTWRKSR